MREGAWVAAFTLFELLVTVAIVALLIALLIPVLSRARQAARAGRCATQERAIGTAWNLYGENSDRFPWACMTIGRSTGTSVVTWDDLLNPFLGGDFSAVDLEAAFAPRGVSVFVCPDDTTQRSPEARFKWNAEVFPRTYSIVRAIPQDGSVPAEIHRSLGELPRLFEGVAADYAGGEPSDWNSALRLTSVRKSEIQTPDAQLVVVERPGASNILGGSKGSFVDCPYNQVGEWMDPVVPQKSLHGTGWNYLFADGHVEKLLLEETVRPGKSYLSTISGTNFLWTRRGDD